MNIHKINFTFGYTLQNLQVLNLFNIYHETTPRLECRYSHIMRINFISYSHFSPSGNYI